MLTLRRRCLHLKIQKGKCPDTMLCTYKDLNKHDLIKEREQNTFQMSSPSYFPVASAFNKITYYADDKFVNQFSAIKFISVSALLIQKVLI